MNDSIVDVAAPMSSNAGFQPEDRRVRSLLRQQTVEATNRFARRTAERDRDRKLKQRGLFLALDDPRRVAERAARLAGRGSAAPDLIRGVASLAKVPAPSLDAALERLIGRNDLLPVAYFQRGTQVAEAVGRVVTTDRQGNPVSYGTAFLVAPDVVLTNHHVLPDAGVAAFSVVQFNYQAGVDGQVPEPLTARVEPDRYVSDETLDFALVGVSFAAQEARPGSVLQLMGSPAKIVKGERVSIIQHANGQPKQVALRDNDVIDILEDFLHYTTDTEPGASGSPVLNDQWEVVALHHAGVPAPDANGQGDGVGRWVANEGIRISRIVAYLQGLTDLSPTVQAMVSAVLDHTDEHALPSDRPRLIEAGSALPLATGHGAGLQGMGVPGAPAQTRLVIPVGSWVTEITVGLAPDGHGRDAPGPGAGDAADLLRARGGPPPAPPYQELGAAPAQATRLPAFIQSLEEGDVLLYSGVGILSEGIKFFTNSDVSHSALYLGSRGDQSIGEAVDAGLIRDSKDQSFPGHNWVVVHRLRTRQNMGPVLARADQYLDQRLQYGYQQLFLLGMLLLMKRVRPAGVFGKMVQAVALAAAEGLNRFLESGRDLMICSEFVYRAYDEAAASPGNPYRLEIPALAREACSPLASRYPAVEAGSLAERLMAAPDLARAGFEDAVRATQSERVPLNEEVLKQRAEKLVAEYLAELRFGRPAGVNQAFVLDHETAAAVSRFAMSLAAARYRAAGAPPAEAFALAGQPAGQTQAMPPALQRLFREPADFVTPADLRMSPSLVEAGRVF